MIWEDILRSEIGRRPLQDLRLEFRYPQLAAQLHQLVSVDRTEAAGSAALVKVGLFHPVPQTTVRDPEIERDLRNRFISEPGQLDSALTELRRVWTWHLDFLPKTNTFASDSMSVNPGDFQ
jgi:hypothetical protein